VVHPAGWGLFVKQAATLAGLSASALSNEAQCYRLASVEPWRQRLSELMPRYVDYDSCCSTLIVEWIPQAQTLTECARNASLNHEDLAEDLGTKLGQFHRVSDRNLLSKWDLPRRRPAVFSIPDELEHQIPYLSPATIQVLAAARSDRDLMQSITELRREWRFEHLIHGDIRGANVLVFESEGHRLAFRLIDWELADVGDAAWDVAGVVQHALLHWLESVWHDPSAWEVPWEVARRWVQSFWEAYAQAREFDEGKAIEEYRRVTRFAGMRLLQSALEHAYEADTLNAMARHLLEWGRRILDFQDFDLPRSTQTTANISAESPRGVSSPPPERSVSPAALFPEEAKYAAAHEPELCRLVEAVEILSPDSFRFAGGPRIRADVQQTDDGAPLGIVLAAHPLVNALTHVLYHQGYARLFSAAHLRPLLEITADTQLVTQLSAALWQGRPPAGNPRVQQQAGYWLGYGVTKVDAGDVPEILRFYLHVTRVNVVTMVSDLSCHLDAAHVPFCLKCLSDPGQYDRRDTAVLFVSKQHARAVTDILADHATGIRTWFAASTPLFTRSVAEGISYAEEPRTNESFGLNRCRLVAEACLGAWSAGRSRRDDRLEAIRRRFELNGLDFMRPHLNPGSVDVLEEVVLR
jgi:hypothetical protein